jgi:hypothetical protein
MDFSVDRLYYSDHYQSFIDRLAYKTGILGRDDFKHDVFSEIIAADVDTLIDCKRAARRIAYQYGRDSAIEQAMIDGRVIV